MSDMLYERQVDELDFAFRGRGREELAIYNIMYAHDFIEMESDKPNWMETWVYGNPDTACHMPQTWFAFTEMFPESWPARFLMAVAESYRDMAYEQMVAEMLGYYEDSKEYERLIEEEEMSKAEWADDFNRGMIRLLEGVQNEIKSNTNEYDLYVVIKDPTPHIYLREVFVRHLMNGTLCQISMFSCDMFAQVGATQYVRPDLAKYDSIKAGLVIPSHAHKHMDVSCE